MMKAKKSLGQNFLINSEVLPVIINIAQIKKGETIIEIGPGLGILTEELIKTGAKILAVEKDGELSTKLQKRYKNTKNVTIIHQDALWFDLDELSSRQARTIYSSSECSESRSFKHYKVVANLPFNIASPIIRKFLEAENPPELMVVMVQKEVAEKIVAKPGNSERGILTLAVEFYAEAEIVMEVSKTNFKPQPKVDAAVLKIKPKSHLSGGIETVKSELFFKIVKAGFSSKRRQIHNSLVASLRMEKNIVYEILDKSRIKPQLRAEDLTLEQWLKLCRNIEIIYT